jgi:hypothetical protein
VVGKGQNVGQEEKGAVWLYLWFICCGADKFLCSKNLDIDANDSSCQSVTPSPVRPNANYSFP